MNQLVDKNQNSALPSLIERAAGMLAGVAVGDALGMPTEFLTPARIEMWYGHVTTFIPPHPQHPHHRLLAGSITDDTDHTLLLAQLLLDEGRITPQSLAERLLAWSQTPRVRENQFVGPSTLKSLAALNDGQLLDKIPRGGVTVGAAMRVAAIAIVFPERAELIEQVVASCSVTHYTFNAISGAMAMAFALSESLRETADPLSVARAAQEGALIGREYGNWSWAPPIDRRIEYVIGWTRQYTEEEALTRIRELIGTDLYPEQLVPCAIGLALLANGDPQQAMIWGANLGGDTDTLASMTGSICGGLLGIKNIDKGLLKTVEEVNQLDIGQVARQLIKMREKESSNG